jgi:hypothetical protein
LEWFLDLMRTNMSVLDKTFFKMKQSFTWMDTLTLRTHAFRIWKIPVPYTKYGWRWESQCLAYRVVSRMRIVRSILFESTVACDVYWNLVQQYVALLELHERDCWFQQDSATCCTTSGTMNMRSVFLGDRHISKSICSPRFPDLT